MKLCDTEIVTFTEGRRSLFRARGTFSRENGASVVRYRDEGDEVTLLLREDSLVMERAGRLSAVFRTGAHTQMIVRAAENQGCIPVETLLYRIRNIAEGPVIHLRYRLLFPEAVQNFTLKIAIEVISEEG